MANPDEYDALKGAGSGAATGSAVAGPWGAVIGGLAGAATPFVSKALGGLFGVDEAEAAQKRAYQGIQRVAEGGTTQAQAGAAYARGRTLQDLQSLASRGTAQQQAGLQRQAMQQAPEVQARYASQLADLRAMEQERARSQLAYYEGERARQEAARKRAALSNAIESAVTMGTKLGMSAGSPSAADDEALKRSLGIGAPTTGGGISSAEAGAALFGQGAPGAGAAASAPTAVGTRAAETATDPAVAAALKEQDPYADVVGADSATPYTYYGGAFGGPQRQTNARGLAGVTPSEERMRQSMGETLADQRTGAASAIPASMPSNFKPTATPTNVRAISKNLQEDRLDPSVAAAMKTAPYSGGPTTTPFGQPDLARSSYSGAQYEAPRETMNNTRMASHDRMRRSLENQVGPMTPINQNMTPMSAPVSSGIREMQLSTIANTNPFGPEPEDVRMGGLRRAGRVLRGRGSF